MTSLKAFTEKAARRYLQNVVFVDDDIYSKVSGQPVEITSILPSYKSPFASAVSPTAADPIAGSVEEKIPYHPKQLVGSFAKEGMVCALYEPAENFETDKNSEIFKLCERADVVIFDWDLYKEDGANILPLIANLVDSSQSSVPHHVRLCAIYTTKPELDRVANSIFEHLKNKNLKVNPVNESLTLIAGATRIIVLGKPDVPNRTPANKEFEVPEDKLAARVIDEFARMHCGLLPSYALHGMSAIRRNSKKILDNFHGDMDGAFLLHRALILKSEDAFDQLPELLAEEVLAVILDDQIDRTTKIEIAKASANSIVLDVKNLDWQIKTGRPAREPGELARIFLAGGESAIKSDHKWPEDSDIQIKTLHSAMGCIESNAEKKLAALFSVRTRYKSQPPALGFGTVIRKIPQSAEDHTPISYAICLMPLCDSIRLKSGPTQTSFPFWTLKTVVKNQDGRGIVLETPDHTYVELMASGKPKDMLWIEKFVADEQKVVTALTENGSYWFQGADFKLEWVAQLKPSHAQRIAHDIGQKFSRVGVVEAEWVRLLTG